MRINDLLTEMRLHEERVEVYPSATEQEVAQTEELIGYSLPESYRQFVTEFSNGAYYTQEILAVGNGNA
jgi:hypothetical protein